MLPHNGGIAAASNAALALAEGDFVAFLDHDDEISPDALFEVAAHLNEHPDTDFIYSDEDKLELDGTRTGAYFKPDWSPEHFLTNMYTCHMMVVRRALLERIGGFRAGLEGAQDYDLVLRLIEHTSRIHHLPKVLYHWRRIPESTAGNETAKPWAHDAGKLALEDYVRRNNLNAEILPERLPIPVPRPICHSRSTARVDRLAAVCPTETFGRRSATLMRADSSDTRGTHHYRRFEVVLSAVSEATSANRLRCDTVPPRAIHEVRMDASLTRDYAAPAGSWPPPTPAAIICCSSIGGSRRSTTTGSPRFSSSRNSPPLAPSAPSSTIPMARSSTSASFSG